MNSHEIDAAIRSAHAVRANAEKEILRLAKIKVQRAQAPTEPLPTAANPTPVVRFRRKGERTRRMYTYAAIRAGFGPRPWAITHTTSGPRLPSMSWDELLDFIGADRWHTIEGLATMPDASAPAEDVAANPAPPLSNHYVIHNIPEELDRAYAQRHPRW